MGCIIRSFSTSLAKILKWISNIKNCLGCLLLHDKLSGDAGAQKNRYLLCCWSMHFAVHLCSRSRVRVGGTVLEAAHSHCRFELVLVLAGSWAGLQPGGHCSCQCGLTMGSSGFSTARTSETAWNTPYFSDLASGVRECLLALYFIYEDSFIGSACFKGRGPRLYFLVPMEECRILEGVGWETLLLPSIAIQYSRQSPQHSGEFHKTAQMKAKTLVCKRILVRE